MVWGFFLGGEVVYDPFSVLQNLRQSVIKKLRHLYCLFLQSDIFISCHNESNQSLLHYTRTVFLTTHN